MGGSASVALSGNHTLDTGCNRGVSEETLRLAAELATDLISLHGPDGRYLYVNAAVQRLTGVSAGRMVGRYPVEFVHPDDSKILVRLFARIVAGRDRAEVLFRSRTRNGRYVWLETNCRAVRDDRSGELREIVAITRDITQRREAEEVVRAQAERLDLAVSGTETGVWDWNVETDETYWTPSMYRLCQAEGGLDLGRAAIVERFIHPDDLDRYKGALRSIRAGALDQFEISHRICRTDGSSIWVNTRATGVRDSTGRMKRVVGLMHDISAQRCAEERAQVAERRLLDAINSSNEGFALWDKDDRLVLCNEKYLDFYPIIRPFMIPGVRFDDMCRLTIQSGGIRIEGPTDEWIKRRVAQHRQSNFVGEHHLADGRWVLVSEWRTQEGGSVGVRMDITALKNQEAELAELAAKYALEKERAEAANVSKSQFLANMSHELRTPLNAILGFAELMSSEFLGPVGHDRYKGYLSDIRESGRHLLELINDLLDMSKIEAGKLVLQRRSIDAVEELTNCLRVMEIRAGKAGVDLEIDAPDDIGPAYADRRAFRQVLLNLLSNGVKFTDRGGRVAVSISDDGAELRFDVCDTGCGIPEYELKRIFEPFEQVQSPHIRTQEGSGLGLTLTKSLVELQEGRLWIKSQVNQGTTVSFTVPRADVQMSMFE